MSAESILAESFRLLSAGDADGAERALAPLFDDSAATPAKASMLMGLIRQAQGRLDEAESLLRAAAATDPVDQQAIYNLGVLLRGAQRYSEAAQCFARTLRLAPTFYSARVGLADALDRSGRHAEAEAALAPGENGLGEQDYTRLWSRILTNQGRYSEAIDVVKRRLEANPDDVAGISELAMLLGKKRLFAEARLAVTSVRRRAGVNDVLIALEAEAFIGERRIEDALDALRAGLSRYPASVRLHAELAKTMRHGGAAARGFSTHFEKAVQENPRDVALRMGCAQMLMQANRYEDAVSLLRNGLAVLGENQTLRFGLGLCHAQSGDLGEAERQLSTAARISQSPQIQKSLTHILLRQGRAEEAFELCDQGMRDSPHDQEWISYYTLALRMLSDAEFHDLADPAHLVRVVDLPTPRGYGNEESYWSALANALSDLHANYNGAFEQNSQAAIQTPRPLMDERNDLFDTFFDLAQDAVEYYVADMPDDSAHMFFGRKSTRVRRASAWTVRLVAGGAHSNHVHTLGWISSAFYARVPPRDAADAPHAGWLKFGEPDLPMPGCGPLHWVEPKVGRLVLFPSYLWHGTEPFPRGERITIAFDMSPVLRA